MSFPLRDLPMELDKFTPVQAVEIYQTYATAWVELSKWFIGAFVLVSCFSLLCFTVTRLIKLEL